jgi:hypothetical protein
MTPDIFGFFRICPDTGTSTGNPKEPFFVKIRRRRSAFL